MIMRFTSGSTADTAEIGRNIAQKIDNGDVISLSGDLGTGKTELVRGVTRFFFPDMLVSSPSFTLVNTYGNSEKVIHHFDFYRLSDPDELLEIGFEEYIDGNSIVLIEWGNMFPEVLPADTLNIKIIANGESCRIIEYDI